MGKWEKLQVKEYRVIDFTHMESILVGHDFEAADAVLSMWRFDPKRKGHDVQLVAVIFG